MTLILKVGAQVGVQGREENAGDCNLTLDKPGLNETHWPLLLPDTHCMYWVPGTPRVKSHREYMYVKSELPGILLNVARDTVTWVNSKKYELYKNNTPVPIM